jgi:ElaB/YqjD/DUF883 family membrane-anchored ribosome-binding protein
MTQVERTPASPVAKRRRAPAKRRANGRSKRRNQSAEISHLEEMIRTLEARIASLTSDSTIRHSVSAASGQVNQFVSRATDQVGTMVADGLSDFAHRVRNGSDTVSGVAKLGTTALRRVSEEVERRPFMTVALALGLGFLAGIAGSTKDAPPARKH